jgi:hypothetical protein
MSETAKLASLSDARYRGRIDARSWLKRRMVDIEQDFAAVGREMKIARSLAPSDNNVKKV